MEKNDLLDPEIKAALFNPIIRMAQLKRLPDKLGLNDIAELLIYADRESAPNEIERLSINLNASSFIGWIDKRIDSGQIPIEGRTSRKLTLWRSNDVLEPILSRDTVKTCLEILMIWPLEEGCLLSNWWHDGKLGAEAIENNTVIKIKSRNKQRDNDAIIMLHAALDEMECKNEKTPSHDELAAFVLSGDFKHSNIQIFTYAEGSLIDGREMILTDGTKLNKNGIIRRYRETIYKQNTPIRPDCNG